MEIPPVVVTYIEAYNRRDAAALAACVTSDIVFENVSNSGTSMSLEGRDAFVQLATQAVSIFAVRHLDVRQFVVQPGQVALEIDWSGTPAIDLPGMPAGKPGRLRGASFMTLRGNEISRIIDIS